jgi:hypothetical protein
MWGAWERFPQSPRTADARCRATGLSSLWTTGAFLVGFNGFNLRVPGSTYLYFGKSIIEVLELRNKTDLM